MLKLLKLMNSFPELLIYINLINRHLVDEKEMAHVRRKALVMEEKWSMLDENVNVFFNCRK